MHAADECDIMDYDVDEEAYINVADCPMCGAPNAPIGSLGAKLHYTCRHCGMWWSRG